MDSFRVSPGFCPECGSIFPQLKSTGNVTCYNCRKEFSPEVFGDMEVEYTLHFNSYNEDKVKSTKIKTDDTEPDGPIVERKCSKCNHDKMSYATVQLRSVDEGQTVFFTCLNCKYKESENS